MRPGRRSRRAFSLAVVVVLAAAVGAFSFAITRRLRTSPVQASATRVSATSSAFGTAKATAYHIAYRSSYRRGWSAGVAAARSAGRRDGRAAARAERAKRALAADYIRRSLALGAVGITPAQAEHTDQCVQVGGGVCEVLGPGLTGRPCPPQSRPDPRGQVVCVPQVLIQRRSLPSVPR